MNLRYLRRHEIQIRDPFVLRHDGEGRYYLYGSTDKDIWRGKGTGFDVYRSEDLEHWEGPFPAFRPEPGFWADTNFWAPEVHPYRGRYYMFATFKAEGVRRGTQVLAADHPLGPFRPHSDGPVTPRDWECLDGTLYVDESGRPWMVFCHEWVQITNGTVCAMPLSEDLRSADGEPAVLLSARDAAWVDPVKGGAGYVTDGPFLYRSEDGGLLMLWSSFHNGKYAQGVARSASGSLLGPWVQEERPLFDGDGGHGMLFRTFDGRLMLTLHSPNKTPNERMKLAEVREENGWLRLVEEPA
ncbi:MAG TPA: glycoside hydrolase family 43 protein [Paenibacillaceae bacterium]